MVDRRRSEHELELILTLDAQRRTEVHCSEIDRAQVDRSKVECLPLDRREKIDVVAREIERRLCRAQACCETLDKRVKVAAQECNASPDHAADDAQPRHERWRKLRRRRRQLSGAVLELEPGKPRVESP